MTWVSSLVLVGLVSSCAFGSASVNANNLHAKLAEGGIYCVDESIEQPVSYVERPDGTTESASPYPWTYADCDTGEYKFTVRMYGSNGALSEAIEGCALGDRKGFVSRGSNWIAFWGGLESLDRRVTDEISAALNGETIAISDLCEKPEGAVSTDVPVPFEREAVVDELMTEIGDEGMPEGAKDCIKQGLSGLSTEELTALRDGETDADVPVDLQDKVVSLLTRCITE